MITMMATLTNRCRKLRDDAVHVKTHSPFVTAQHAYYFTKGVCEAPAGRNGDNSYLTACGVAGVMRNAASLIQEGELIVGHNYGLNEYLPNNSEAAREVFAGSGFSPEQIEWYFALKTEGAARFTKYPDPPLIGQKAKELMDELAVVSAMCTSNHSVIGYEKVLRLGLAGCSKEVEYYSQKNGGGSLYDAVKLICEAGEELGLRYALKAEELLAKEPDPERRAELSLIAGTCRQVPYRPARSFFEAVQSLWFAHMINTWEDYINANSLGRLDRILYPYYKADIEKGILTKEEAFEIICCLWIKLYRDYDVQQSCIGGCDSSGNPAENELSYMMLDATEALDFVRCLSVRYSARTDKKFIERALEVVGRIQKGVPFFFNDDVMIPSLESHGIAQEDARDYTQIGCVETVIPGKSNPHAVTSRANFLKALEYTLGNGRSMMRAELRPGLETGEPESFGSFEQLKEAVFEQIRHLIRVAYENTVRLIPNAGKNDPRPYKSLLTEGCIESGRDFNDRGAKYDNYEMMFFGVPNLADSLAAINRLIFQEKRYTMGALMEQLRNNFPDEAVRLDFVNKAPKFGNDVAEVDSLMAEILNMACDYLQELSVKHGYMFFAQPFTFLWMVDHGKTSAASADGRRNGEILAYSVSPMQGRDHNGFTALINSLSSLPTKKTPGTTSAIVEADPQLFTDRNIPYFADILRAGAEKGLCNVQFNVVTAETLLDAQVHPENHRNLAVRVSGFSQKFYLLDKTIQDHIIGRTKHTSM
jgi:formate C-acetyltransferase